MEYDKIREYAYMYFYQHFWGEMEPSAFKDIIIMFEQMYSFEWDLYLQPTCKTPRSI